ncbi:MAG: DHA2 family efflux MFS transporter permease subunit [Gemmataceae bacterium]|nr:DHA2 family efflux MFS transporter permease subunit [Gemmataceae bacterium]
MATASPSSIADPPIFGIARKWWVVVTFMPSLALMGLNSTIIDIPNLVMIPELDTDRYRYQWTIGASLFGAMIGMAMLRWLRDRFGLRTLYVTGMFVYAVGMAGCGSASDVPRLTPFRFLQGLGEGMVVSNVLATMWREFPVQKDLAMAFYGVSLYFGKVIAPSVGAWITDNPNWHWIFYGPAIVALVTFILSWWILLPDKPADVTPAPFDFPGLWLLVIWVLALIVCLFRGQKWGWTNSREWVVLWALFLFSFIAWVTREAITDHPLIDLRLFRRRTFVLTMLSKSLYVINMYGVISTLCDYMVTTRGYPRTTAGLVLLPGALAMGASLILSGIIVRGWDRKSRIVGGLAGMTIMTWQLSVIDLYTDKWLLCGLFVLWGAATGLVISPLLVLASEGLTQTEVVTSAALKNMVRIMPGTFGATLIGTLVTRRSDANFDYLRQDITHNRAVAENVAGALTTHLTSQGSDRLAAHEQASHVVGSYIHANATAFASQTALQYLALGTAASVLLALFLRPPHAGERS